MAKNVLVTGGAGYIGSHTVLQLLLGGFRVVVVDNLDNSSRTALDRVKELAGEHGPNLSFQELDLREKPALEKLFSTTKFDAVIHFAGLKAVGESVQKPLLYYNNNLIGTITLLEVMGAHGCKKLVFSSSATVYGWPKEVPCTEDFPVCAMNPYGRTKLVIEEICRDVYRADPDWKIMLLRYFNPVGVSNFHRFVPKQWRRVESGPASSDGLMIDSLSRLLEGFVKQGDLPNALRTFSVIRVHASSSSSASSRSRGSLPHSASSLLLLCANLKQLLPGKQLHAQIVSLGLQHHPVLVPRLVNFYTAFDLVLEASVLVRTSDLSQPFAWNLLISCHVRNGLCKEAISIFREMLGKGVEANEFTYPSVLKACGEEFYTDFGKEVHKLIANSPFGRNLFVQNALMSMYGRFGEIDVVRHLFEQMPMRDAVSWNTLISAYAFKGMWEQAFELFESMWADGIELTSVTWNTIAGGCLCVGNYRAALELISHIRIHGNHLDCVATLIGLGACSHIGALKLGKEIHGSAVRSYYHGFNNVRSAMITMYSRCKDLKHAHILFQSTEEKSITTWNSMISGYCHSERCEEASFLFREMLSRGIEPNFITIASILPLCARVANLQHGREFHCYIVRRECFVNHLLLWNALVDMYARSGKVLAAKKLFDMMTERDAVTYTSLIAGYGVQGEGQIALRFFEEMITSQITPDHVTMAAVLSACSHAGMVIQGERLFKDMQRVYLITPHLEHYACMVDLYGRAGLLAKASDVIARMPHSPTPAMWAILVGACQKHRNLEMGKWAAGRLLEMRPENSGYYTLVANMYAAAGCWSELAVVRALMRDLGVKKAPGCAWLDAGSCFSPFVADDASSPHAHEIYPLMEGLSDVMKDAGHIDREDMNAEVAVC